MIRIKLTDCDIAHLSEGGELNIIDQSLVINLSRTIPWRNGYPQVGDTYFYWNGKCPEGITIRDDRGPDDDYFKYQAFIGSIFRTAEECEASHSKVVKELEDFAGMPGHLDQI